ncbi:MAG TPA: hypothetical protein VF023_01340, partial [Bryobacteraceae bacterium]
MKWRFLVVAGIGIVLIALATGIGHPRLLKPTPIQTLSYITVNGQRLATLFDNLPKDSHYAALKKALDARRRNPPACDNSGSSKFARALQ